MVRKNKMVLAMSLLEDIHARLDSMPHYGLQGDGSLLLEALSGSKTPAEALLVSATVSSAITEWLEPERDE